MLGVASASPYIPDQQARDAQGRPHMPAPPSQQQQNQAQPFMNNGAVSPGSGFPGMPTATPYGVAGAPDMPTMSGYAQAPGGVQGTGRTGPMPGNQQLPQSPQPAPYNGMGMQSARSMNNGNDQAKPNTKPARRGFLSTILDWFQFSR